MKRQIASMFLAALALAALFVPAAQAAGAPLESFSSVRVLKNGVTVETTLVVYDTNTLSRETSSKTVAVIAAIKNNGSEIATITLTANFGYNGSSAWVNSSSVSKSVASGWKYSGESLTHSGGTAQVTAVLSKGLITVGVDTSLTCSPTGEIS